jgi:hypothetical protein
MLLTLVGSFVERSLILKCHVFVSLFIFTFAVSLALGHSHVEGAVVSFRIFVFSLFNS